MRLSSLNYYRHLGRVLSLGLVLFGAALGAGCRSTPARPEAASSDSLVSAYLEGVTPESIRQATLDVFKQEGFETSYAGPTRMVFERPGTTMDNVAYGGWYSGDIWLRVKVEIRPIWPSGQLIEMDAFKVGDREDSWFEDEHKVRFKKGPYKKLMERIQERIGQVAP